MFATLVLYLQERGNHGRLVHAWNIKMVEPVMDQ